jgi:Fe-S-cluster containining protein
MGGTIDTEALLGELRTLYARVDAHYAQWRCPSSTECCRFGITGKQPYVTSIELALVERAIAKRGGMPSAKKRALPLTDDARHERICPLLNRDNKCSIYSDRPFGCRTFFCERATQGDGPTRAVLQAHVNELRSLAERHTLGGDAPRPLMRALGEE